MTHFMQAIHGGVRLATVAMALAASSPAVHAQQPPPAAIASAKELIKFTGATTLFSPLIVGVIEQAKNLYLQQDPSLARDLNEIGANLRTEMAPRFSQLTDEVARIYATRFTDQEIKDILAFYKSPAGQKMLSEQPKVVESSMKFAQDWSNKLSDEVVVKMRDELKKKGHAL